MLTLYDCAISGNCYKARLLLAQLGREHRRVPVDILKGGSRTDEFRRLNPFYRVPFLVDGDFGLAESNAILLYLARGTPFLPDDERLAALVAQWMFFEQNQLEAAIAVSRFVLRWEPDAPNTPAIVQSLRRRGRASLDVLEGHLSNHPFLVGERYSVADIALFGYTPLSPEAGFPLEPYPSIRGWISRVEAQPGYLPME